jgi:hypothetical protein
MRLLSWTTVSFAALAAVTIAPSCGGTSGNSGFPSDDGGMTGSSGGGSGSSGGGSGSGSGGNLVGEGGSGGSCAETCSADLHNVVDCHGNVVTMCPPDQGCAGTTCVDACASASANKSTFGCEYYAVDPDIIAEAQGACFAMYIANTWTSPVNITADWGGQPINVATAAQVPSGSGPTLKYVPLGTGGLQPGQVAILFLDAASTEFACPAGITAAFATDGAVHGTATGKAFHVKTDRPVVSYDIFPFGGGSSAATSATLLVPTSAWDVNYIAVNPFAKDVYVAEAQPFIEIVASVANTTVSISPTAAIVGGTGIAATAQGATGMYTLAAPGDYIQFTQDGELTGSPILANNPVGVWGGASCLNIDVSDQACDSAHQQLFPVNTLGHEYIAARYRDRWPSTPESTPWRIVGAVNGTTLTYQPSTPNGAPTTLNVGQVATFWTIAPFVVTSQDVQHPFYMSAHMSGGGRVDQTGGMDGRGDPEFVNVMPPEEWLASYVFFTDPTYPETNLVFTRKVGANGMFSDVTMDCGSNGTSVVSGWLPVGSSGTYEYARFDLSTGNFQGVNGCNNGRHTATSPAPFGLTVWGWGSAASTIFSQYVSYAYPAGASVQPINTIVVQPGAQ